MPWAFAFAFAVRRFAGRIGVSLGRVSVVGFVVAVNVLVFAVANGYSRGVYGVVRPYLGRGGLVVFEAGSSLCDSRVSYGDYLRVSRLGGVRVEGLVAVCCVARAGGAERDVVVWGLNRSLGLMEAEAGRLLSAVLNLTAGSSVELLVGGRSFNVSVVGVLGRTGSGLDMGLVVSYETAYVLRPELEGCFSILEVRCDCDPELVKPGLEAALSPGVCVEEGGMHVYVRGVRREASLFIYSWSLLSYLLLAGCMYIVGRGVALESRYEVAVLRAVGASKRLVARLLLCYLFLVGLFGCLAGFSFGLVSAQAVTTLLSLVRGSAVFTPALTAAQAIRVFGVCFASMHVGAVKPVFDSVGRDIAVLLGEV